MEEVESTVNSKPPPEPKPKPVGGIGNRNKNGNGNGNGNGSGSRFQCPKCPKTFTRIENLTRHQANHEDIGKFPCVVCKKRFTRSDLLNRHRRIHGPQPDSSHVPKPEFASSSPDQRLDSSPAFQDSSWSASFASLSPAAMDQQTPSPSQGIGVHQQGTGILPHREGCKHPLQPGPASIPVLEQAKAQGLTSLMQAALAPHANFSFTPAENVNPSSWDGFMQFGENTSMYMGSYDADMSWTLDYLPSESSPTYLLDQDMLNVFDDYADQYRYQPEQQFEPQPPATEAEDAEGEDEDSSEWPDQVEKAAEPDHCPRTFPIQERQISWQSVIVEARASGLASNTIRPMQNVTDQLRNTLLDILKESNLQNEVSRPETMFPPTEALDYFLRLYIYDCQYPALFNNQPYVSKAETTNCVFPCSEDLWEAHNSATWKMLVGPPDMPPPTYYLHALNSCLLRKWIRPAPPIVRAGEFGKIVLIYALHTHIFEWRQATSMLNPTGLMGTFGNSAHDMGDGLRERRKWLIDGLDSFAECYKNPASSTAALLLHHLGYVSLDVSLSDMHLLAGRSVNRNDGYFAEENLKFWANSTIAEGTMGHVGAMLQLCYQCIDSGVAADASYEVAVCLFTGGMVCWAFAKLSRGGGEQTRKAGKEGGRSGGRPEGRPEGKKQYIEQVRKASLALRRMGCWRMSSMFGRILEGFMEKM
ncbi:hypothetical protein PZA11_005592 [Diplocarpon coronariae]